MAYGRLSNASLEDWYKAAKNIDQNHAANKTKPLNWLTEHQFPPVLCPIHFTLFSQVSSELFQLPMLTQLPVTQLKWTLMSLEKKTPLCQFVTGVTNLDTKLSGDTL